MASTEHNAADHVSSERIWDNDPDECTLELGGPCRAAGRLHAGPDIIRARNPDGMGGFCYAF